jgi:YtkA-like protein
METTHAQRTCRRALVVLAACACFVLAACTGSSDLRSETLDSPRASSLSETGPGPARAATDTTSTGPDQSSKTSGGAGAASRGVPVDSRDAVGKRLAITLDEETVYIKNGGRVDLDDGLAAEIYLDPYPPTALRSMIDVRLTQDGQALTDAGLQIDYDMLAMAHGPFSAEAKNIGGGHYLVSLDYIMFGPWEQVITIRIGLERIRVPILVVAYP